MRYLSVLIAASLILFLICPYYVTFKHKQGISKKSIALKAVSTGIAVIYAAIGTFTAPRIHNDLILIALLFGILGDILLERHMCAGGISFLFGNLIYVYLLLQLTKLHWYHIVLAAALLIFIRIFFKKQFQTLGVVRYPFLLYAAICFLMFELAISCMFSDAASTMLFGFGTFLFAVSDCLLAVDTIYGSSYGFHSVSLNVYYMAQFCIACSVFLFAK